MISVALAASGIGMGHASSSLETTLLCPLVAPPRDTVSTLLNASSRPYGTDLGFSYSANGSMTLLFGDTWPDHSYTTSCPGRMNDDAIATLSVAPDWPGFTASGPLSEAQCPKLDFVPNPKGTEPAPILVDDWNGSPIFMGPLNTPVAAFHDGLREWGIFITALPLLCPPLDAIQGKPCPSDPDPAASQLTCGLLPEPVCIDPTSSQGAGLGQNAVILHIAERIGPHWYKSRYAYVTNKFLNMTVRTVRAFDPSGQRDYGPGSRALLVWGRPGFDSKGSAGEAPPYLFYHPLPFERSGEKIVFEPRYFREVGGDGTPIFVSDQVKAQPLYRGEFDPVVHMAVSYIPPLERWMMLYGGDLPLILNYDGDNPAQPQPVQRAVHARLARDPWGPWTSPAPTLTPEQVAPHFVCSPDGKPNGCLPRPIPPIRPACLETADLDGRGRLYGVNILDAWTRDASSGAGVPAADVFWNVSTWHPYGVLLMKTRIELDAGD